MSHDNPSIEPLPEFPPKTPRRRRGGQPGNLNAFQHGAHSRLIRQAFRFAPPGPFRDITRAAVVNAVRYEILRLPDHPTSEERAEAVRRALRRVGQALATRNYREARSPKEVYRLWSEALRPVIRGEYDPDLGDLEKGPGTNRTNRTNR